MNIQMKFAAAMLTTVVGAGSLGGCTSAERAKMSEYFSGAVTDTNARVTCYSGGLKIYDGFAEGKIQSESSSDGYYFIDRDTGRLREVSGNCDIDYGAAIPEGFEPTVRPDGYQVVVKSQGPTSNI